MLNLLLKKMAMPFVVASQEKKTHETPGTQQLYWQDGYKAHGSKGHMT